MAELSTNPFRRKGPTVATEPSAIPQAASPAAFLESITSTPDSDDPREGRPIKTKVVKRVRVQSPPPLSPDSPVKTRYKSDDSSDDDEDPFEQRFPAHPGNLSAMPEAAPLVAANQGPDNPFSQSFDDAGVENDREIPTTASAPGKGALDVNAFSRLLLTGQSGRETSGSPAGTATRAQQLAQLGDNSTETSSISKQSLSDGPIETPSPAAAVEVTPRTSHEVTDHESEETKTGFPFHSSGHVSAAPKKAPPPPSSRHGKVIKPLLKDDLHAADGPFSSSTPIISPAPRSPSDINKPLPPAPRAHDTDDEVEDIFAREAAGKVPEQEHDATRPSEPSGPPVTTAAKKPTPAPPPRRGHSRSESKQLSNTGAVASTVHDQEPPPRSSLESQHSRVESAGGRHAPAPPPPRRLGASHRLSSHYGPSVLSPTSPPLSEPEASPLGFSAEQANVSVDTFADEQSLNHPKIAPPPPPPARNPSTRRPNTRSAEGPRRVAGNREKENTIAPPPPPPRQRGSSKGSMDAPGTISRTSFDSVRVFTPPATEGGNFGIAEESAEGGKGADILADLDALQREVDALRGKFGNAG